MEVDACFMRRMPSTFDHIHHYLSYVFQLKANETKLVVKGWSVVDSQCRLSFQRAPFLRKTEAVQSLFCDSSYLKVRTSELAGTDFLIVTCLDHLP